MKHYFALLALALAVSLPGRAEFLRMDISIFGMD
jgi:hypothetical protein